MRKKELYLTLAVNMIGPSDLNHCSERSRWQKNNPGKTIISNEIVEGYV